MNVRILLAAVTALGLQAGSAFAQLETSASMAEELAQKAHKAILAKMDNNPQFRVAVFAFGDAQNKVTVALGGESMNIQGELIFNLRKLASGKYFVLDKAGLAREFQGESIDPTSINPADPAETAKVLVKLGISAGLVGAMQVDSAQFVSNPPQGDQKMKVEATLIFDDGTYDQELPGEFDPDTVLSPGEVQPPGTNPSGETKPSGRFNVEILVDGQVQQLQQGTDPNNHPQHHNVFFIVLPRSAKGKEVTIRLTNNAQPPIGWRNVNPQAEQNRLFAVAVKVDGVNSIYQADGTYNEDGTPHIGPVVLHPINCSKWVLTGPGKIVRAAPDGGFVLDNIRPGENDHSVRPIPGFQKGKDKADVFTLATARESIAETVGISNELGLIEAHFYPMRLDGDVKILRAAGIKAGRRIRHDIHHVNLDLYYNPVEVWRIFYRYEDQDLGPIAPVVVQRPADDPVRN